MAKEKQPKRREGGLNGKSRGEADHVLLKALSHPVRARALTVLNQR